MMHRKTQLAAAVGAALVAFGTAAVAQAPAAATVQVYGQVSRALLYADDGTQKKWFHVDNDSSGTRFGVTGTGQAMPGLRAGFRIEVDLQSNESHRATFTSLGPSSDNAAHVSGTGFAERHMDAWVEGAWGRINIGQGDGAANGATESDLSGTGMANGIGVADLGGGFGYRVPGTTTFGPTIAGTINQQDFESRYDRLMYVTPTFAGFRAQVSYGAKSSGAATVGTAPSSPPSGGLATGGNSDVMEISAWYGSKLPFGEIAAAAGWSSRDPVGVPGTTKDEYIGGSFSWLANFGLNVTLSYSKRDNPTTAAGQAVRESEFKYLKVGYKFGAHAIAVDYAMGDDFVAVGDEAKMYGIGYVWNPIRWLEIHAGYKIHSLDRAGANFDDVTIGHVGTRVRF